MNDPEIKKLLKDIEEVNFRVNDETIIDDEHYFRGEMFSKLKFKTMISDDIQEKNL